MELRPLELTPEELKPFVQIQDEDVSKLLPILEKRLPCSVFLYNAVVMYPRFLDRMSFYTLFGEMEDSAWIVSVVVAEDYGLDYTISAPEDKLPRDQVIEILDKCPLFKWDEPHLFTPLQKWLTSIVFEVSVNRRGNIVEFHPSKIFWADIEASKRIEVTPRPGDDPTLQIQPLTPDSGVQFILSNWKYAKSGTESVVSRVISRNESGAVYINGEPVCGVMVHAFGMLSALYTLTPYRQRGYANLAMKYAMRSLAQSGIIPASVVDVRNAVSTAFHEKLGCQLGPEVMDYVIVGVPQF